MNTLDALKILTTLDPEPDIGGSMANSEFPESGPRVRVNGRSSGESVIARKMLLELGHIAATPAPPKQIGLALIAWAKRLEAKRNDPRFGAQHLLTFAEMHVLGLQLCNNETPTVPVAKKMVPLLKYVEQGGLMMGNGKLPFAAYAEFPLVTCPGAGGGEIDQGRSWGYYRKPKTTGCANFCYSFKAARNLTAVRRWVRLTLSYNLYGIEHCEAVFRGFEKTMAPKGVRIMRLFVDGDFRSTKAIEDWMRVVREHPSITVYGYSKSWNELLELDKTNFVWPTNYVLNISSGSRHSDELKKQVLRIAPSRGEFIAVSMEPVYKALERVRGKERVTQERHVNRVMVQRGEAWCSEWNDIVNKAWADPKKRVEMGLTSAKIRDAKTMMGSQLAQAVEGRYLVDALKELSPGERGVIHCPIDCGNCPSQMRPGWPKVQAALRSGDKGAFFAAVKESYKGSYSHESRQVLHHCGNARQRVNIVIPVH
jgi:hypothetical protein